MKILIAIEDEVFGDAIVQFLAKTDWPDNSEMKVIHVVEPLHLDVMSGYSSNLMSTLHEQRQQAAKKLLLSISSQLRKRFPLVNVQEEILDGRPKEVILSYAKNWTADLIVVGSHGRSGVGQFFLGSVSMSVLSAATCSIMIVKLTA